MGVAYSSCCFFGAGDSFSLAFGVSRFSVDGVVVSIFWLLLASF